MEHQLQTDAVLIDNYQICRICLVTDSEMYSMTALTRLNEAYEGLTGLSTADEEHLPRSLCSECTGRLMTCARFRHRSLRAHLMLLDIYKRHGHITVDIMQSEIKIHNPLSSDTMDSIDLGIEENKFTDAKDDTYVNIDDMKFEIDSEINNSCSEMRTKDMNVNVKLENDYLSDQDDFNASNIDENNVKQEINADVMVTINNGVITNNEDVIINVLKLEHSDISDENTPIDYEIYSDDTQEQSCLSQDVVEDPLCIKEVRKHAKRVRKKNDNDMNINRLETAEHGKGLLTNMLHYDFKTKQIRFTDKIYPCNICNKVYKRKDRLKIHMKGHCREKSFSCDICKKAFGKKGHLNLHLKVHSGEKPYSCEICKKSFRQKCNLTSHLITHSRVKSYFCDICKKDFSCKRTLDIHLLIHSGEKPFTCDICDRKFRLKNKLNLHLLVHSGKKPYPCDICKKKFRRKDVLRLHLRVHSGEKPFSCHICKRKFSIHAALKAHVLTHRNKADRKTYICDICNNAFTTKSMLKTHISKH